MKVDLNVEDLPYPILCRPGLGDWKDHENWEKFRRTIERREEEKDEGELKRAD